MIRRGPKQGPRAHHTARRRVPEYGLRPRKEAAVGRQPSSPHHDPPARLDVLAAGRERLEFGAESRIISSGVAAARQKFECVGRAPRADGTVGPLRAVAARARHRRLRGPGA
ncbi:hypothetical protein OJF2_01860 [Aquisphaera giovannonii]|uniref:Uncharacterized protein n=1 Tax=Aquisphaera giovannonii TaxID=406548 RepID=A0A5B9VV74_9BACT|nr:hypothetical protein [Aquisphaera giovannonii]QEH31721.1 hypothetical protein OJF2_01860 [Aquisphaera giovannonii]